VAARGLSLDVTKTARDWLVEKGYDPVYGARPMRRLIQAEIEDPLSELILAGKAGPGAVVRVGLGKDGLRLAPKSASLNPVPRR
jgi:ATP-dependent Clp protease ATP-binding subunit ClpA